MGRIDQLLAAYRRQVELPLNLDLPLSQRVWFAVYPPEEERVLINRIGDFEIATKEAGRPWASFDLEGIFADWMDTFDESERLQCLATPEILESYSDPWFKTFVCKKIQEALRARIEEHGAQTVFALTGLMELYDFTHVSAVVDGLDPSFPGILLVFFPGARDGNSYRFLDARSGWNYLAVPILAEG
jgi:hypothetical protein